MKKTKIEKIFKYRGLTCVVSLHVGFDEQTLEQRKWRCGYVTVGRTHWCFEDDYDLMPNRSAYGHVNYTDYGINFDRAPLLFRIKHWIQKTLRLSWYIGFDSNHDYMDGHQGVEVIVEECKALVDDLCLIEKDKGEFYEN